MFWLLPLAAYACVPLPFAPKKCTPVAASVHRTCVLTARRAVKCVGDAWLSNGDLLGYGVSGIGATSESLPPPDVNYSAVLAQIDMSMGATCVLTAARTMRCTGMPSGGTPGLGVGVGNVPPVVDVPQCAVADFAAASFAVCVVYNDSARRLQCFGSNTNYIIDSGLSSLAKISPPDANLTYARADGVATVGMGDNSGCFVVDDGRLYCFGSGSSYQLGGQTSEGFVNMSADMTLTTLDVCGGTDFNCALGSDHRIRCFGLNNYGQLGRGHTSLVTQSPAADGANATVRAWNAAGADTFASVACGRYHVCAVTRSVPARVACWGYNMYGRLGLGDQTHRSAPVAVDLRPPSDAVDVESVALGLAHSCVSMIINATQRAVLCWGEGTDGALGTGNTNDVGWSPTSTVANAPLFVLGDGDEPLSVDACDGSCPMPSPSPPRTPSSAPSPAPSLAPTAAPTPPMPPTPATLAPSPRSPDDNASSAALLIASLSVALILTCVVAAYSFVALRRVARRRLRLRGGALRRPRRASTASTADSQAASASASSTFHLHRHDSSASPRRSARSSRRQSRAMSRAPPPTASAYGNLTLQLGRLRDGSSSGGGGSGSDSADGYGMPPEDADDAAYDTIESKYTTLQIREVKNYDLMDGGDDKEGVAFPYIAVEDDATEYAVGNLEDIGCGE